MIAVNFVNNPEDNVNSYIFLVVYSLKSCDTDYKLVWSSNFRDQAHTGKVDAVRRGRKHPISLARMPRARRAGPQARAKGVATAKNPR